MAMSFSHFGFASFGSMFVSYVVTEQSISRGYLVNYFRNSVIMRFMTVLATCSFLFVSTASKSFATETCEDARQAASNNTSGALWFGAGCLLNGLGVIGAYVLKPDPPMSAVVGKDAVYVAKYTDCYKEEAVKAQTKWAWIGCGASVALYVVYFVVVAAAVTSTLP